MAVDPDILPTFLTEVDGYLRALRDAATDGEALRRAAHGLKGAASMLELTQLVRCARRLETVLATGPAQEVPDLVARAARLTERLRATGDEGKDELGELEAAGATPVEPAAATPDVPVASADAQADQARSSFDEDWDPDTARQLRALFVEEACDHLDAIAAALLRLPEASLESTLDEVLRKAHTLKGSASTVGLRRISDAAHRLEETLVTLRGRATLDVGDVDRLLGASDLLREMVSAEEPRAGELLLCLRQSLQEMERPVEAATGEAPAAAPERRVPVEGRRLEDQRLRVDVQRLDDLMNTVGELVIDRTRVERRAEEFRGLARDLGLSRRDLHTALTDLRTQSAEPAVGRLREVEVEIADSVANLERATATLLEDSEALRRTTHLMQELLSKVRMMPISWLHARLQRPLHEMARSEGKQVELVMDDESSQMDRSMAEQITDTLIQLIRNAVAHGVETPDVRRLAGKPATGKIRISARHQGDMVFINVEDDGAGLDPTQLRAALRDRGHLSEPEVEALSDDEVLSCIFAPGFSTRREADTLAGRGVGLDVVRRTVAGMGGSITVSSRLHLGTRFELQLPLTTAIAQALLLKVGEHVFAVPVAHVVETAFVEPGDLRPDSDASDRAQLQTRDGWIPLLYLHRILGGDPPLPLARAQNPAASQARQPVVILRYASARFAVTCTRIVGTREIVLKRLGKLLASLPAFAGATISGSSKVQFILDVAALARRVGSVTRASPLGLSEACEPRRIEPLRVLLADDSRSIREAVSHILRAAGYSVDVAADGWEAWERLQLRSYDLLLTDLEMPRLHGYDLIAKCRRAQLLAQMPIIVLTSRTADRNREVALERGANAFVAKPINRRLVLDEISSLLPVSRKQSS
jgi:chemosensory pili system protein ChpA (sensor histidine kinase/response regulator)